VDISDMGEVMGLIATDVKITFRVSHNPLKSMIASFTGKQGLAHQLTDSRLGWDSTMASIFSMILGRTILAARLKVIA